ncbi:MAG: arsenosugar biosynthesis radical SAM protein ArsS, partial [Candidatus Omnitrophica bacterium]|nr:arsenosugar biosynthesis radical SAM protein ArsS [Candidatus Omnitrophota bacterium]
MENNFKNTLLLVEETCSRRIALETLQVNLGNMCNQRCVHCHVDASPKGNKLMSRKTMDDVISFLSKGATLRLDITGGCPELNPNFKYLIAKAKPYAQKIMVRNNLSIFFEKGMEDLPEFYKQNKIKLICSMPCYTQENVDKQRGSGAFEKSIKGLKLLNSLGYAKADDLQLDLVYNPGGAFLPGEQQSLQRDYKKILLEQYGVVFNQLLTITNAPIKRFEQYLKANGNFDQYMKLLMDNFNKDTLAGVMCRNLLSVGWDGIVYDCDFN